MADPNQPPQYNYQPSSYPPPQQGSTYPPPQGSTYPPQGSTYPPQGGSTYPPQGGSSYPPQQQYAAYGNQAPIQHSRAAPAPPPGAAAPAAAGGAAPQSSFPAPTATTWCGVLAVAAAKGMSKQSGCPTVVIRIEGMEFKTAERKSSGAFPKWGDDFFFKGILPGMKAQFELQQAKTNMVIMTGEYVFTESDLKGDPKEVHVPISPPGQAGQTGAHLSISIFFFKEMGGAGQTGRSIRYTIHTSTMFGVVSQTKSQSGQSAWPCYVILLNDVQNIFGNETQPWNRKYDAAQKIFGPGPRAKTVRMGVTNQHNALYRNRGDADKVGDISCGDDFFAIIKNGVRRGRIRYFTYAITENKFQFTETGAKFGKDFMSKHAMHANCAEQVVYAGEFVISKNLNNGNMVLVIDNNSGTYAPNKALLPKLKQLMEANFPFCEVQAISYDDPLMAVYKDRAAAVESVRTAEDWA
uniref:C2 domain-containing protein n=1 Tax=Paramoeba aestuarina TaxID=180227 RepID=A0A7S4NVY3_9EUKA